MIPGAVPAEHLVKREGETRVRGTIVTPTEGVLPQRDDVAVTAPAVRETDDADYRSDHVVLPHTVPELIRAYEMTYKSHQSLQHLLAQATASDSPSTATPSMQGSATPTATSGTAVSAAAGGSTTPGPTTSASGVVKGRVLCGTVPAKENAAKVRLAVPSEQWKRLAREVVENSTLQAKNEVVQLTSRVHALQAENDALRKAAAVTGTTSSAAGAAGNAEDTAPSELRSALDELQRRRQREEALCYERAQLRTELAESNKQRALLEEVTKQLEGQIQRLLSNSVALMGGYPDTKPRTPPASTDASHMTTTTTATPQKTITTGATSSSDAPVTPAHASGGDTTGASAAPAATASAPSQVASPSRTAGQVAALEKQIDHLRRTVDKLQASVEAGEQRRTKLEAALRKSRAEHAEAKENLLQYRRQVNESEITAETDATEKDSEARARAMEKECIRLRTAFAERKEHFAAELAASSEVCAQLKQELVVYSRVVPRLLRQLAKLQIECVVHTQRAHSTERRHEPSGVEGMATRKTSTAAPEETVHAATRGEPTAAPDANTASTAEASAPALTNGEASATLRTLSDDQQSLLKDIKSTYERRLESLQAHMRAETKHLRSLNKELRAALATSQEEARVAARQLDRLRNADATTDRARHSTPNLLTVEFAPTIVSPDRSGTLFSRTQSFDMSPLPSARVLERGTGASRALSEAETRYDPENMSTWEAVQIENEALLARLSVMQEEKWRLSTQVEDLRSRCAALEDARQQHHTWRADQLLAAFRAQGTAGQRNGNDARLRSLQALLQDTLQENMALEDELTKLRSRFGRAAA